jgi:hypothetical protein
MPQELNVILEVVKGLSPVATAVIALIALRNWQRQEKAKRQAEFLDSLIEAAHTYIAEMPRPMTIVVIARIGMNSHAPIGSAPGDQDAAVKGAIAYIERNGLDDGKRLLAALQAVQPSVIRLRSLVTKGQVFKFRDYARCQDAVTTMAWQFNRLESFTLVFGSGTWNWDHPEVLTALRSIMSMDPEQMRRSLEESNVALIEFATEAYRQIYG